MQGVTMSLALAQANGFQNLPTRDSIHFKEPTRAGAHHKLHVQLPKKYTCNLKSSAIGSLWLNNPKVRLPPTTSRDSGYSINSLEKIEKSFPSQKDLIQKLLQTDRAETIDALVHVVKQSLSCLIDTNGEVSVSAYDTAWVARIPAMDANGGKRPQFPDTLQWIVNNQHADGSWGDEQRDWIFDRMSQTLACVVALQLWNYSSVSVNRGVDYLSKNAQKLASEEEERMPIGFELVFTALIEEAFCLGLSLPYNTPFFDQLKKRRKEKLARVPLELLHSQATTMLHNLEGLQSLDLDWSTLLKFQSADGSMCASPSSTAVLYLHTKDEKCLSFLTATLAKFDNAVPTVYPLDIFHNLWVVDTLERLGISRYFKLEIEQVLQDVYKYWSDQQGICWAKTLKEVPDLDDSSMAFRLLQQHGFTVSAEAFKTFQKEEKFVCFAVGQMTQGVSNMFNTYRASQMGYPGEQILEDAFSFSQNFLVDALGKNKANADKWSLRKDLAGEVEYALKFPEFRNLKNVEVRQYIDKYGPKDAWIGKTIYRLPLVNNSTYLALAKKDFSMCEELHQRELLDIIRWMENSTLSGCFCHQRAVKKTIMFYTIFAADLWEPESSATRIAAAKCFFLMIYIWTLFNTSTESSLSCLEKLSRAIKRWDSTMVLALPEKFQACYKLLFNTLLDDGAATAIPKVIADELGNIWAKVLEIQSILAESPWRESGIIPSMDDYLDSSWTSSAWNALVLSTMLMSGEMNSAEFFAWRISDREFLRNGLRAVHYAKGVADFKESDELSDADSLQHLEEMKKQVEKELCSFRYKDQETGSSPICRRVVLTFTKVAQVYYSGDYVRLLDNGLM